MLKIYPTKLIFILTADSKKSLSREEKRKQVLAYVLSW